MSRARIFCEHIEPIWQNKTFSHLENQVDIWKMSVQDNSNLIPENTLSNDEILKASRFLHSKDRASFILRRTALRTLLSRYTGIPASEIEFIAGKNKKPELKSELNNIRFNVSHSGDLILIAISASEVGVDIERIETGFNYSEILKHSFSEQEINQIEHAYDSRGHFFRLWTRKEALTKASSKGLDDDLKGIPSIDGWHSIHQEAVGLSGKWQINSFNIDEEYLGSIAYQAEKIINFLYFEF